MEYSVNVKWVAITDIFQQGKLKEVNRQFH